MVGGQIAVMQPFGLETCSSAKVVDMACDMHHARDVRITGETVKPGGWTHACNSNVPTRLNVPTDQCLPNIVSH